MKLELRKGDVAVALETTGPMGEFQYRGAMRMLDALVGEEAPARVGEEAPARAAEPSDSVTVLTSHGCGRCPIMDKLETVCLAGTNLEHGGYVGHIEVGQSPGWCPLRTGSVVVQMVGEES